jgi:hypothetical protein
MFSAGGRSEGGGDGTPAQMAMSNVFSTDVAASISIAVAASILLTEVIT